MAVAASSVTVFKAQLPEVAASQTLTTLSVCNHRESMMIILCLFVQNDGFPLTMFSFVVGIPLVSRYGACCLLLFSVHSQARCGRRAHSLTPQNRYRNVKYPTSEVRKYILRINIQLLYAIVAQ